jgi:hypothetical protein
MIIFFTTTVQTIYNISRDILLCFFFIIITVMLGRKKDSAPNSFGNVAHEAAVSSSARFLSLMDRYRFKRNKRKKKG